MKIEILSSDKKYEILCSFCVTLHVIVEVRLLTFGEGGKSYIPIFMLPLFFV